MKKLLSDMKTHPTKSGGTLKITGPRDKLDRCQFVIEWEAETPRCMKCGLMPGEGAGPGTTCSAIKTTAKGRAACGGEMSRRRGQVFFTQPEKYVHG